MIITRPQIEKQILTHLKAIHALAKELNPKEDYLSMAIIGDAYMCNNKYWVEEDDDKKIDFSVFPEKEDSNEK